MRSRERRDADTAPLSAAVTRHAHGLHRQDPWAITKGALAMRYPVKAVPALIILALTLLGVLVPSNAIAAPRPHAVTAPAMNKPRPTAVTAISDPTTCQWAAGLLVTFDTGEVVCVGLGFNARPSIGTVDSFWRAYWSTEFPFYHDAGFTQNGTPDVISFSEL
jgi:hypothetical protein